ncbi:RsmB/NOP family class I SAM-dependent RNA methyltransferase [Gordonibacter massiliensis (ex Traore et al. 2017)]|nr:transcription antitermination factor NusB [Gordonibacter massiliensis (ex Traore et al. 2017)]
MSDDRARKRPSEPGMAGRASDGRNASRGDRPRKPQGGSSRAQGGGSAEPARKERPSKASPARLAALDVGREVRRRDAYAQDLIAARIDKSDMSPEDRAFATLLALGVASCVGTLDEALDRALNSPADVQDDVRDALRIAVYEILFLNKSPHAAVDQGVELVRFVQPRAAGLGNAVLRRVVAMKEAFPFGDPTRDVAALARLHAFPLWLAKRLIADVGPQAAVDFMRASNEPAPLFVAVNEIEATLEEVRSTFAQAGSAVAPVEIDGAAVPGCLRVPDPRVLQDGRVKRLFAQGKVLVSDAASQLVAESVLPAHMPASFLEVGAGRGTKTILLQSGALRAYGSQMELVALDNHAFKTDLLRERARTYGAHVAEALTGDATRLDDVLGARLFDAVFIDAPCSGLGTLRRHPEIRWRLTEERMGDLAALGLALLRSAAGHVAPRGQLAYATCTVAHVENNAVVKRFLESPEGADFELAPIAGRACVATRLAPGTPDAHFAVRFARKR